MNQAICRCGRIGRTLVFVSIFVHWISSQKSSAPLRGVTDPGIVTTRQALSPAGVPAVVKGRVYGVSFSRNSEELLLSTDNAYYLLDWKQNRVLARQDWTGTPGLQSLRYDAKEQQALSVVAVDSKSGQAPRLDLFALKDRTVGVHHLALAPVSPSNFTKPDSFGIGRSSIIEGVWVADVFSGVEFTDDCVQRISCPRSAEVISEISLLFTMNLQSLRLPTVLG